MAGQTFDNERTDTQLLDGIAHGDERGCSHRGKRGDGRAAGNGAGDHG